MKNYISQFFGPAGQTTKNINHWFIIIRSEDIHKKTYDLLEEGGFSAIGVQRPDLPKQGRDFIVWIPSDNAATLQRPHVQFHGQSHELSNPYNSKDWRTSREITPRPEALELLLPWRIAVYGSAFEAIKKIWMFLMFSGPVCMYFWYRMWIHIPNMSKNYKMLLKVIEK